MKTAALTLALITASVVANDAIAACTDVTAQIPFQVGPILGCSGSVMQSFDPSGNWTGWANIFNDPAYVRVTVPFLPVVARFSQGFADGPNTFAWGLNGVAVAASGGWAQNEFDSEAMDANSTAVDMTLISHGSSPSIAGAWIADGSPNHVGHHYGLLVTGLVDVANIDTGSLVAGPEHPDDNSRLRIDSGNNRVTLQPQDAGSGGPNADIIIKAKGSGSIIIVDSNNKPILTINNNGVFVRGPIGQLNQPQFKRYRK